MSVIKTHRLLLEKANLEDGAFFFELLNSPNWVKYIGDRGIKTIEDAQDYIQKALIKSYQENGFGLYKMVLKTENIPIGLCGLLKRSTLDHPDIGFAVLPGYAKQGYAFEAAEGTMNFASSVLGLKKVLAITTEDNRNSRQLLSKIGLAFKEKIRFEKEGKEYLLYSNNE